MIDQLINRINEHFTNWMFVGSIVDWHYFDGQVIIKDFDIVTSDPFEPDYVSPVYGPRKSFVVFGKAVDVFVGEPTGRFETPDQRVEKIRWIMTLNPNKTSKYEALLKKYEALKNGTLHTKITPLVVREPKTEQVCGYRGEQLKTITCNVCGSRGKEAPVYSCSIHGQCTHRKAQHGQKQQDPPIWECVGCDDGPWKFE